MTYKVNLAPEAGQQLDDLLSYIDKNGGRQRIAEAYVGGIHQFCMNLANFPNRGKHRKSADIPNLRTLPYKGRAVIAFTVDDAAELVTILEVYYGGQDYESYLGIDTFDG